MDMENVIDIESDVLFIHTKCGGLCRIVSVRTYDHRDVSKTYIDFECMQCGEPIFWKDVRKK